MACSEQGACNWGRVCFETTVKVKNTLGIPAWVMLMILILYINYYHHCFDKVLLGVVVTNVLQAVWHSFSENI